MSTDWIPVELLSAGKRSMVRWVHAGQQTRFIEPFFDQSIAALVAANAVQKLTPIDALAQRSPARPPQGFIFHVSRCGSTLISRSLAGVPTHRVISEPGPFNQLLLADLPDKAPLLQGLIRALCANADEMACFIKFTSWNLLFLEQILALFPDTPWIFVYREPVDVVQSLLARPPGWAANAPLSRLLDLAPADGADRLIFTLEKLFAAPLPHRHRLARAVNYAQLPGAIEDILAHFGQRCDPLILQQMGRVGQYDAKQAGEVQFVPRQRAPLTDALRQALAPLDQRYQQWEQIRNASDDLHAG